MIREHEDDWEQWLVPALSESDGAEMRTRAVGETGVSVEERVLRSSLRSIKREERDGVAALFLFTSVFPEDVTIPAAVIDALAGEILVAALAEGDGVAAGLGADSPSGSRAEGESVPGTSPQEQRQLLRRASSTVSSVRRWLRIAIDHSLILGSISEGIRMHDLVRDYARRVAQAKDGGLAAIQRRAFSAILAAAPEGGFVDLALASTAEKGAELSLYFAVQAPFHLSEAFPADMPIASTGGKVHELILGLLEEAERTGQGTMRLHVAMGISAAQLEAAADMCEHAANWLDAGRIWAALGSAYQSGLVLRRAMLRATAALVHVGDALAEPPADVDRSPAGNLAPASAPTALDASADFGISSDFGNARLEAPFEAALSSSLTTLGNSLPSDEAAARELEANCWLRVMNCADTNFKWGSPEWNAARKRLVVLGQNGCATAQLMGLLTVARPAEVMKVCCWGRTVDEHKVPYLRFEEKHGQEVGEIFMEAIRAAGQ
jgi:hypothetical protein